MNDHLAKVVTLFVVLLRLRDRMSVRAALLAIAIGLILGRVAAIRVLARREDPVVALLLDLLHLAVLEVRAGAEHPGYADEGEQEQDDLHEGLARVELLFRLDLFIERGMSAQGSARGVEAETHAARRQEHLDEHVEQVGRLALGCLPVHGPLVQDAHDEVAKDRLHEEDLGQELGPDEFGSLEVEVVEDLEADGERHLVVIEESSQPQVRTHELTTRSAHVKHSEHDRHLHLERVGKDERVVGAVPARVETEPVPRVGLDRLGSAGHVLGPLPLRGPDDEREREDVVVDETGVDGESSHEEDDIAAVEEGVEDLPDAPGVSRLASPVVPHNPDRNAPRCRCPS